MTKKISNYEKFMASAELTEKERELIELASAIRAKEVLDEYYSDVANNALYIRQQSKTFFLMDDMLRIKNKMVKG